MSKMLEYHTRAMDFVAQATMGQTMEPVDEACKQELLRQALDWGLMAIEELEKLEYHDLTYSVIHRSIAATALDYGEHQLAEQLAAKPIVRGAHPAIAPELRVVMHKADFQRRLQEEGLNLAPEEVEMSLDGPAVGNDGIISWSDWRGRISTAIDFMEKIVRDAIFKPPIFISRPRSSSFAVSIRLGSPIESSDAFNGMDPIPAYIEKFMSSMSAVNQLDLPFLHEQFDDPKERSAFLNTARSIAPDGKRIEHVKFTNRRTNREDKTVAITKTIKTLPRPAELREEQTSDEETINGKLLYADGRNEDRSQIRIVAKGGDVRIDVPEDKNIYSIVDEMWNCDVEVAVVKSRGKLLLRDITLRQPDMFSLSS